MKIHTIFFLSEFVLGGAGNSIYKLCKNLPKKLISSRSVCVYMRFQRKKGLRSLRSLRPLTIKLFQTSLYDFIDLSIGKGQ